MRTINRLEDIVAWRLCLGCGACAYICPEQKIEMVDRVAEGIRPRSTDNECSGCRQCLDVCPAVELDQSTAVDRPGVLPAALEAFGPILEIWEGHAVDPEIRSKGSSGGALTALALHCLEHEGLAGVLHIGQHPVDATRNSTRLSTTRADMIACMGSRYAPASVCERLDLVESAAAPCVVIGQPSEIAALKKILALTPALASNIGLTLSFFCAGSPATQGTLDLMKHHQLEPSSIEYLRYRGFGWPGFFATRSVGEETTTEHLPYREAWAYLQKYRPYATHLFPDGSGEDADISCGDPWYRAVKPGEPGSSLIVVRTERGRRILRRAIDSGALAAQPATYEQLANSQGYLTKKRGAVWGRLLAYKLLGLPTPRFTGYALLTNWRKLSWNEKQRSIFGTMRRIVQRGYYQKLKLPTP